MPVLGPLMLSECSRARVGNGATLGGARRDIRRRRHAPWHRRLRLGQGGERYAFLKLLSDPHCVPQPTSQPTPRFAPSHSPLHLCYISRRRQVQWFHHDDDGYPDLVVNTYGGFFGPWAVRGQFLASLRGQFVLWIMLAGTVGRLSNTMQVLQVPCYPTTSLCR